MTTRGTGALVSLFAILALDACRTHTKAGAIPGALDAHASADRESRATRARPTIRIDNESADRIHVYLVGDTREWLLGPVEPGTRALLALPAGALAEVGGMVQLAVLARSRVSMQAGRDARAVTTLRQPTASLIEERWVFAQGQLTALRATGGR